MLIDILLLIGGFLLILGGANYLTDGSSAIAQHFRVPEFIIGLTVVAIGTSMPELVVSSMSALKGQGAMAIGNVVGSNVFNVLMVLGVCALIKPIALSRTNIRVDIPIGIGAAALLAILTIGTFALGWAKNDSLSRPEGVILLMLYIAVMIYSIRKSKGVFAEDQAKPKFSIWLNLLIVVVALAVLICGGEIFLKGAVNIARSLGVAESVIAITLVAVGTSFPELASSVVSVLKGRSELALGNVIGSNVANILLVLGFSASLTPLSLGSITNLDILMVIMTAFLLFLASFTFRKREIDRVEGVLFLVIYAAYITYLVSA